MSKYCIEAHSGFKTSYANCDNLKELDEAYKYTKSLGFKDYEIKVIYNDIMNLKENNYESSNNKTRRFGR